MRLVVGGGVLDRWDMKFIWTFIYAPYTVTAIDAVPMAIHRQLHSFVMTSFLGAFILRELTTHMVIYHLDDPPLER